MEGKFSHNHSDIINNKGRQMRGGALPHEESQEPSLSTDSRPQHLKSSINRARCSMDSRLIYINLVSYNDQEAPPPPSLLPSVCMHKTIQSIAYGA